jgi:hypothetical protein
MTRSFLLGRSNQISLISAAPLILQLVAAARLTRQWRELQPLDPAFLAAQVTLSIGLTDHGCDHERGHR